MPTVQEILKQSGLTDEQIAALDTKAVTAFSGVLTAAEQAQLSAQQAREKAELETRAQQELYSSQIAPALDAWANEKAQKEAEIAFYRTQAEQAKAGGFIPKDAPGYTPPAADPARGADGKFVPGTNGSPVFMTPDQGIKAVSNATWAMQEHFRLYGQPMPDDFDAILQESTQQRMPFKDYVAKKYNFDAKRNEIAAARQKEHDDKIRAEAKAAADKEWAERVGGNPNVRVPVGPSQFDAIRRGVDAKTFKDPLSFGTKEERRAATQQMIAKDLADNAAATVH